jgi:hypothetical protein
MHEWGLSAADVGALAARDTRLVAGEPGALASRISMLAWFFKVPPMPVPQSADASLDTREHAGRAQLRHLVLHGPDRALYMSLAALEELMNNYVRLGLFATKKAARQGLYNSGLVKPTSWRVLVRRTAAVRAMGGSPADEPTAAMATCSAERVLEAGMLREYAGCAPTVVAATSLQAARQALGHHPNRHMGNVCTELRSWCGQQ